MSWLVGGDPRLAPSADPRRSQQRLRELRTPGDGETGPRAAELAQIMELAERSGAGIAERVTAPGHLTASAVVVDAERCRVLVLFHTKLRRWLQPGGHADGDHELAGVALREATEETGIDGLAVLVPAVDVDIHHVDHGDELGTHLHLDLRFVVSAPRGAVARGNHESTGLRWVTVDELVALADDPDLAGLAELGLHVARGAPEPPGSRVS